MLALMADATGIVPGQLTMFGLKLIFRNEPACNEFSPMKALVSSINPSTKFELSPEIQALT